MTTKDITVNQGVFHCPIDWTVEQAETRIRSRFGLQNGGIEQDNVSVLGTVSISSLTGSLAFAGGSQADEPLTATSLRNILSEFIPPTARSRPGSANRSERKSNDSASTVIAKKDCGK